MTFKSRTLQRRPKDLVAGDGRCEASNLFDVFFDGRRPRSDVRHRVWAQLRCPQRHHLISVVFRTARGSWAAWRADQADTHSDLRFGWACGWVDETPTPLGRCPCHRTWYVDVEFLADAGGVTLAGPRFPELRDPDPFV